MLGGCSFQLASSVNDLVSPISPFGENADVKSAMDAFVSNGYSLKNPSGGEYNTSYNFYDIDCDGEDEAVSFYEPKDNLGEIYLAILKKQDSSWSVIESIAGFGKDVYSLDFHDVNNDGVVELVVCWDVINNSSNHMLAIYNISTKNDSITLKLIDEPITINNYIFVDYNSNGTQELLLFEILSGNYTSSKAELYSLRNNRFKLIGETKLDSHITSYTNLQIEKAENDIRVYADAIGSDGASMLTEVIYWSDTYNTIISPFYSYSTGRTKDTSRKAMIGSIDINDDKLIEIPTDKSKKLPKQVRLVDWKIYKNTTLIHKAYSFLVENDNYTIVISDKDYKQLTATYDAESRELVVLNKNTKKSVFSVKPVLKALYDEKEHSDYTVIMEKSGYYYLAKLGNDTDIKSSIDILKKSIKSC